MPDYRNSYNKIKNKKSSKSKKVWKIVIQIIKNYKIDRFVFILAWSSFKALTYGYNQIRMEIKKITNATFEHWLFYYSTIMY